MGRKGSRKVAPVAAWVADPVLERMRKVALMARVLGDWRVTFGDTTVEEGVERIRRCLVDRGWIGRRVVPGNPETWEMAFRRVFGEEVER